MSDRPTPESPTAAKLEAAIIGILSLEGQALEQIEIKLRTGQKPRVRVTRILDGNWTRRETISIID